MCTLLPTSSNANLKGEHQALRNQRDPTHRYGTYAYRLPDDKGRYGLWISYEDPESAQSKVKMAQKFITLSLSLPQRFSKNHIWLHPFFLRRHRMLSTNIWAVLLFMTSTTMISVAHAPQMVTNIPF